MIKFSRFIVIITIHNENELKFKNGSKLLIIEIDQVVKNIYIYSFNESIAQMSRCQFFKCCGK